MSKKTESKSSTQSKETAKVRQVPQSDPLLPEQIEEGLVPVGAGAERDTFEKQAELLAEPRLSVRQRQAAARRIGRESGNRYLTQVIQRVRERGVGEIQREDGETGSSEPYGQSTTFGTFMVYPESFVGPLPVAERTGEPWPIREADYQNLLTQLGPVSDGTSNIVISGDSEFQLSTLLDLGWLMTSGVGQELISEIQTATHTVTITETNRGNSIDGFTDDAMLLPISPPMPGPGSNVTVHYNPTRLHIKDGTLDWHHRPPAIGLAHELIHAWEAVNGMLEEERREGVFLDEYQTVGLAEFSDLRITENRFRASFGLPLRPEY